MMNQIIQCIRMIMKLVYGNYSRIFLEKFIENFDYSDVRIVIHGW